MVKLCSLRSVQIKLIKTGGSRRKHIARGNRTAPADVNRLLNRFQQMKKMLKKFSGKGGNAPRLPRGLPGMFG